MAGSKSIQIILARQLASCVAAPILLVDTEGTLVYYNESAEEIFNRRFDETGEMGADEHELLADAGDVRAVDGCACAPGVGSFSR